MLTISSTDSVELAVHLLPPGAGPGDGPAGCILAHATGFHGRAYGPLAGHLFEGSGRRTVAPDLRGHGDSTSPDSGYSWSGFAEDLLAVLDHLSLRGLPGVGHSMGGAALLRAEQERPGTFSNLFLYEPIVFPSAFRRHGDFSPLVEAARRRRHSFDSEEDAVRRYGRRPPLDALDPKSLGAYVRHGFRQRSAGGIELKLPGEEEAEVYRMSTRHDTWDRLSTVTCPTVIAHGRSHGADAAAIAPGVAEQLPAGRLLTFEDLGHFGPLEKPERISSAVLESWSLP